MTGFVISFSKMQMQISPQKRPRKPRGRVEVQLYSFFNLGARCGWVINATPVRFTPRKRRVTNCRGVWVSPRAVLDGCGKSRPYRHSIPGSSSQRRVAIPTELFRLNLFQCTQVISTAREPEWWPEQRSLHSVSLSGRFGIRTPVGQELSSSTHLFMPTVGLTQATDQRKWALSRE